MDHRPHIVVVEDEAAQRQLLVDYLGRQNFRVSGADGGTALRKMLERELPALVLLDVGLPGEDGFVLARWLRERSGRIGIIMVTAAADTVDRVVGLETGADDYIAKPFEPRELLARVKSVLRRTTGATANTGPRVRMGRRVLDLEKRVLIDPASGDEETLAASVSSSPEAGSISTRFSRSSTRRPMRTRGPVFAVAPVVRRSTLLTRASSSRGSNGLAI